MKEYIEKHESEFKKKYKNTLDLNDNLKDFKVLENCKNKNELYNNLDKMFKSKYVTNITNFLFKNLKIKDEFKENVKEYIEKHENEFKKKYKNTLDLNDNLEDFKVLENCKNEKDLYDNLDEILKSTKLNKKPDLKNEEILMSDDENEQVKKFKEFRHKKREKTKENIINLLKDAGMPNDKIDESLSDLYIDINKCIPKNKYKSELAVSPTLEGQKESLERELDKKNGKLWKAALNISNGFVADSDGCAKLIHTLYKNLRMGKEFHQMRKTVREYRKNFRENGANKELEDNLRKTLKDCTNALNKQKNLN